MPYAQWHYPFEHAGEFASHFPADYICEGIDQTRGWFYSLLAIATAVFDKAPYRNVIVNELVLDAKGQKMSKSRGNVVNPWDLIESHGADAARLYLLMSSQVWQPKRFDAAQLVETAGKFLNTLKHTYNFLALYGGGGGSTATGAATDRGATAASDRTADRWLLGRLDATVAVVRAAFDNYDVTSAVRATAEFVDVDLSNWYVRLNRSRFWAPDTEADAAAVATLEEALVTTARLLAPAAPFASDWLHRALTGGSVHLAPFPVDSGRLDPALDRAMSAIRTLASLGRAAREKAGIRVRQPLAMMKVAVPPDVQGPVFESLIALLASETNVKCIEVVASDADLVRLRGKANFRTLGKRFGADVKSVAAWAGALPAAALRTLEGGAGYTGVVDGRTVELLPEDVVVEREVVTDWPVASEGQYVVALDPAITDELASEGLARELVNRIQRLRKDAGYDVSTRILLAIDGDAALLAAAGRHREHIMFETLARDFHVAGTLEPADRAEGIMIDSHAATLVVRRFGNGRTLSGPAQPDDL
jgi:isoleucyl-tRNA synthetase